MIPPPTPAPASLAQRCERQPALTDAEVLGIIGPARPSAELTDAEALSAQLERARALVRRDLAHAGDLARCDARRAAAVELVR